MRHKGPSTSRPASFFKIDRKRRTPSVIVRFNDKMYIMLYRPATPFAPLTLTIVLFIHIFVQ